jgi:hypothetical protein
VRTQTICGRQFGAQPDYGAPRRVLSGEVEKIAKVLSEIIAELARKVKVSAKE